jgi:hypothetical protein
MRYRPPNLVSAVEVPEISARSQPSGEGRYFIAMGLVLCRLAKVRVSPAHKDVIALNSRHHADALLRAAPDRHFHSEFDSWSLFTPAHYKAAPPANHQAMIARRVVCCSLRPR